jgi:hypothetical protein
MGPATPHQRALGVPWGGHLRWRLFCSNLSRAGAANNTFFWGSNVRADRLLSTRNSSSEQPLPKPLGTLGLQLLT